MFANGNSINPFPSHIIPTLVINNSLLNGWWGAVQQSDVQWSEQVHFPLAHSDLAVFSDLQVQQF